MKTKIISFIVVIAFITTAFDCNLDPIKPPHTLPPLFQELQGRYQSDDGYTRLTLNTNRYSLYLGGTERRGNYSSNEFGTIELDLIDGTMSFEIRRDLDEQIVGLVEVLNGDPVLHRMGQEEKFIFDNLDMEIIRKNLGGRYSGTINDQDMILALDNVHNRYYMQRGDQDYFGNYDTELTAFGVILVLHLQNEPKSEVYNLRIIENRIERITSFNVGIQEGLHREVPPLQAIPIAKSHIYTQEEINQIGQNLIGQYEGTLNNEVRVLNIKANTMNITINDVTTTTNYRTSFFADSHPSLAFKRDGVVFSYQIVFAPNSHTEISELRSTTPNLPTFYFKKIKNHPVHDKI